MRKRRASAAAQSAPSNRASTALEPAWPNYSMLIAPRISVPTRPRVLSSRAAENNGDLIVPPAATGSTFHEQTPRDRSRAGFFHACDGARVLSVGRAQGRQWPRLQTEG